MGEEAEREQRLRDLASFQVNAELMALTNHGAILLHRLPVHRGEEVTAGVIDGPQSAVWQQTADRLPTEQALLLMLTRGPSAHDTVNRQGAASLRAAAE
jgi:ornithine carbamoyltransferase